MSLEVCPNNAKGAGRIDRKIAGGGAGGLLLHRRNVRRRFTVKTAMESFHGSNHKGICPEGCTAISAVVFASGNPPGSKVLIVWNEVSTPLVGS